MNPAFRIALATVLSTSLCLAADMAAAQAPSGGVVSVTPVPAGVRVVYPPLYPPYYAYGQNYAPYWPAPYGYPGYAYGNPYYSFVSPYEAGYRYPGAANRVNFGARIYGYPW